MNLSLRALKKTQHQPESMQKKNKEQLDYIKKQFISFIHRMAKSVHMCDLEYHFLKQTSYISLNNLR